VSKVLRPNDPIMNTLINLRIKNVLALLFFVFAFSGLSIANGLNQENAQTEILIIEKEKKDYTKKPCNHSEEIQERISKLISDAINQGMPFQKEELASLILDALNTNEHVSLIMSHPIIDDPLYSEIEEDFTFEILPNEPLLNYNSPIINDPLYFELEDDFSAEILSDEATVKYGSPVIDDPLYFEVEDDFAAEILIDETAVKYGSPIIDDPLYFEVEIEEEVEEMNFLLNDPLYSELENDEENDLF